MSTVAERTPGQSPAANAPVRSGDFAIIGKAVSRVDGPLKVSGHATYTSDFHFPGMRYAVPVGSTVANGRIASLDIARAEAMPGVRLILHRGNIQTLYRVQGAMLDEARPPFDDDVIRYYGQYVALVVADTFEQATAAAAAVDVRYESAAPNVDPHLESQDPPKVESERGDAAAAFDTSAVRVDETYVTPTETHNPIELHATVAVWDGEAYTLYETSQAVVNHKAVMVQMLGTSKEKVRVITHFLGSGFGGKLWPWPHSALAAAAARQLGLPVKLVLSRPMMFQNVGHRPLIQQRMRLGADRDGKLLSLRQDYLNQTSILDDYAESCGEATPHMYSTANLRVTSGLARRHIGTPTSMRGPGAVPGLYALESAMDELAIALNMDPVALRLRNEPEHDEGEGTPFSSRHLVESLRIGADRFGWAERDPAVGSMRRDGAVLGWGMAACSWMGARQPAQANVELRSDGSARVACATQDIGTGTYTIMAQLVSAETGIPLERIQVVLGDTALPDGPLSGGSTATASVIPAVLQATRGAVKKLLKTAAKGKACGDLKPEQLTITGGRVHAREGDAAAGVPYENIVKDAGLSAISADANAAEGGLSGDPLKKKWSINSYGAHFVEVLWWPEIARLRVNRVVTVIDAGRMLNPRAARNQIEGAVVMGVGMALFEHTQYDPRDGAPVNRNLADYVMATHADSPEIDVTFLDYPDPVLNELGARGVGEIGLAGTAAAIANAVYHATGVRKRELPIMIEDLLGSQS
ncbi:xanthine dehydrogenase family protein molybdopterin-binding subunit [Bordetella sp. N]|uniref:xanthine dehydrogenase family protein molybdopterin-binding subunit n=1 Tax=Bordetella sp. N TaxID=1746199 RepID=UPI00070ADC14|nr:xanthine dehydrogenase family protein molybdopterin-binding subunit [Bordetella sp. N]ALM84845.1 oxidoreductase [Bordetella sp. N]